VRVKRLFEIVCKYCSGSSPHNKNVPLTDDGHDLKGLDHLGGEAQLLSPQGLLLKLPEGHEVVRGVRGHTGHHAYWGRKSVIEWDDEG